MSKTSIAIFWLLLLVPALLVGAIAFNLLRHEEERLENAAVAAAERRAQTVIDNLALAIDEVRESLADSLRGVEPDRIDATLAAWERKNPLVRNVFIQESGGQLRLPDPASATAEERGFVERFDPLLSGRNPWSAPTETGQVVASVSPSSQADLQTAWYDSNQQGASFFQTRRSLKQLAANDYAQQQRPAQQVLNAPLNADAQPQPQAAVPQQPPMVESVVTGWTPWYADNRLHLVAWARRSPGGPLYGAELEMVSLLSRLLPLIPSGPEQTEGYALLDGGGSVFHRAGPAEIAENTAPAMRLSIPALPHWELAVYRGPGGAPAAGFLTLLYTLLIAIFVLAILLGGSLLMLQAHRSRLDAQRKTSFVSNVSHELKTPLTTIRMYAELIGEGRVRDDERKQNYMRVIVNESQRLTRLVNNVLDFGRLEQNRKNYHVETLDLAALTRELADTQRIRVEEAGMTLALEGAEAPAPAAADRDAFEQALLNLVDNAVKYARDGRRIEVELDREPRSVSVRVMDRGPGVPHAHREKIFEKFHRVDASLTAKTQGSGLGLTIARRLMRDLGGDLTFAPREGGGACFTLTLPRVEEPLDHEQ